MDIEEAVNHEQWYYAREPGHPLDEANNPITRTVLEAARLVANLQAIVDEQANDEGLWFVATTAPEAYLQQELRRLHAAIEAAAFTPGTTK